MGIGVGEQEVCMKEIRNAGIPEFKSLEEEKEYWEARGPLAEGHKGKLNKQKPRKKRSSFLAVRLTGEELTRLRDVAAKQGLGPSTYARILLTSAIERQKQPEMVTLTEIKNMMENFLSQSATGDGQKTARRS
jgi:predicted DNA binding CopG/RHH family protein